MTALLLVEEPGALRELRRSSLEKAGYRVSLASDALQALRLFDSSRFSFAVVHLRLPYFDGAELLRRLRAFDAPTVIVLVGSENERERAFGGDAFVGEEDLESLVSRLESFSEGAAVEVPLFETERSSPAQMKARGEFLAGLSHEIASPLTPLVGYLKLLRVGKLGALTEKQQQVVEAMALAAERLGRSIDNLVDYASFESGQYRIVRAPTALDKLVESCLFEMRAKAKSRQVRLEFQKSAALSIEADERKLRQALANIVENAVRQSPHGGCVLVELRDEGPSIVLSVFDQGSGFSPGALEALAAGRRLSDDKGASGLGLPVARQIALAHGGELRVECPPSEQPESSTLFSGSRLLLRLPKSFT